MSDLAFPTGTILGYPRIGPHRELKKLLEGFWSDSLDQQGFEDRARRLREEAYRRLIALGLDADNYSIPDSFSFYDHVLDAAVTLGAVPERFMHVLDDDGQVDLLGYMTLARGDASQPPLEMTKWFDSNYHYLVPEILVGSRFYLASDRLIRQFVEAKESGVTVRPALVGPVTFLLLAKSTGADDFQPIDKLSELLVVYKEFLARLSAVGCGWIQLDEPGAVSDNLNLPREEILKHIEAAYEILGSHKARPNIFVSLPYGDGASVAEVLANTAVEAIGFDMVRGSVPLANPLLETKTLVGGVVDGRNIWRQDLSAAYYKLERLSEVSRFVAAATSTSLMHLPHDVGVELNLDQRLKSWLAFADQKVEEIVILTRGLSEGRSVIESKLDGSLKILADRMVAEGVRDGRAREILDGLKDQDFRRIGYAERAKLQAERLNLPLLPITTIGSFPQTLQIRKARADYRKGRSRREEYAAVMRKEIQDVVDLQEKLDLDVLVHGEPERNDMVQYFAEHLTGFAATENGWVQSYGSRCVRPPILWGDVARVGPMTVEWSVFAQGLTARPVKGMLTGPVTILAWSFVRDDQPLEQTAMQVALALREELADLERAGIHVIQVDEPALRELLPLVEAEQDAYLDWSVKAFRLATSGVKADTQIHTHLCYSEFGEIIDAISRLDADVTSVEAARSRMEILADLRDHNYSSGIGPGIYDIHSPRAPSVAEVQALLELALEYLPANQLWVNPDCGLKTRGYEETVRSLENVVTATKNIRRNLELG